MRNIRKEVNYKYLGMGFTVIISEVELRPVPGEKGDWAPKLNMSKLHKAVFEALLHLPIKLTGAHIRFIRSYMEMNQETFGKAIGFTNHTKISEWESKSKDKPASLGTKALVIRVLMKDFLGEESFNVSEALNIISGKLNEQTIAISKDEAA